MCVDLIGYSERGMMNAISEDLAHSSSPDLVGDFLSQFSFPTAPAPDWKDIKQVKILVEQSFSDFGDADMLILIEHTDESRKKRKAIFVEAKVSNDTDSWKTIDERWREFLCILDGGEGSTSNLLVQLHRKVRLVEMLRNRDQFATDLLIPRGTLGSNQTVDKAANLVQEFVCEGDVYFVAILPDTTDALTQFFGEEPSSASLGEKLPCWSVQNFGFLSWHKLASAVTIARWPRTMATFEWNAGQIFRPENPNALFQFGFGNVCLFENRPVYIVGTGRGRTCRVARLNENEDEFFWRTFLVDSSLLSMPEDPIQLDEIPRLPQRGGIYSWNSGQDSDRLPSESVRIQIQPNTNVIVIGRPSWETTRVQFHGANADQSSFLVFTHHLRR